MTRILVAGATGLVGGHVLGRLLIDDRVTQIVAPTRRPLPPHSKLLNPLASGTHLPVDADWWNVDGAISALGTTRRKAGSAAAFRAVDFDYAFGIAERVRRNGATRFALTSATGADSGSRFLYTRTKGELEEAVRRLDFPSFTIVRPGLLAGERAEHRPLEHLAGIILHLAGPILPARARVSPASTVAAFLVEAAIGHGPGTRIISAAEIATATPPTV